jgi:hypothetical protein
MRLAQRTVLKRIAAVFSAEKLPDTWFCITTVVGSLVFALDAIIAGETEDVRSIITLSKQ